MFIWSRADSASVTQHCPKLNFASGVARDATPRAAVARDARTRTQVRGRAGRASRSSKTRTCSWRGGRRRFSQNSGRHPVLRHAHFLPRNYLLHINKF